MIIISDTTPIVALLKVNQLHLLRDLFGNVVISKAVFEELTTNPLYSEEAQAVRGSSFLEIIPVTDFSSVEQLIKIFRLDLGESESIVLAKELKATRLLIDERKGRSVAETNGISIMGTIGVLMPGYKKGLLTTSEALNCLEKMKRSGIRISDSLYRLAQNSFSK